MASNLVIVESPAKAKTIENYLGKGFVVKSSFGHVRDLPKKGLAIDVEGNFEPTYEVTTDKKKVVQDLKSIAKKASTIWLATDEDREGEAISWHLVEALKLKPDTVKRITFNEITKTAVTKAIETPRSINIDLVNAQQARRVLDRLVGFELSPVLWRKVKPSLSAGRVQSVTVRLIVEREREIKAFTPTSSFKVVAIFETNGKQFKAELTQKLKSEEEAQAFLGKCIGVDFRVDDLQKKPAKKTPAAPFTTSTLQQEASRKLGFSVARTMSVAQKLYEAGKITYMRTDSVNLSDFALENAKDEIVSSYGKEFSKLRKYKTKDKGAQEAHEAIRPTDFSVHSAGAEGAEERLYELIWKRSIASQMSDAELERTTVKIKDSNNAVELQAVGEILKFEGFLKVYLEGNDDEDDEESKGMLPALEVGQALNLEKMRATERFTRPPARYTEASLVKKLEELGIGRPSTYAPTISTIQKRGYVERGDKEGVERKFVELVIVEGDIKKEERVETAGADRKKMMPTDIGTVVNDFLTQNFERILDYNFTASVEKEFDDIANGAMEWTKMIAKFYQPFHTSVQDTLENSERATGERLLGEDPESGKPVYARIGRFGPMIQIGDQEDEEKPKFASILKNQSIESITFEEAMDLFKLPRQLGEFEDKVVTAAIGRFGPYVRHNNKFVSIKKDQGDDPMTITLERAVQLIEERRIADKNKTIKTFDEDDSVQVLNGRYGPYIKMGRKNVRIPKDTDPTTLTLEMCKELAEAQPAKTKKRKKN